MILTPISLVLNDVLLVNDKYIPLTKQDMARLVEHIPDGEEMLLTIRDNLYTEWVRVENQCGTIILHRGHGGSVARKFPRGSCVFFEASVPVIKWLICNYDCCEHSCQCLPVELIRTVLPTAYVNELWFGILIFNGSEPINFALTGLPSWAGYTLSGNRIELEGTPAAAESATFSISATNCQGSIVDVTQHTILVKDR